MNTQYKIEGVWAEIIRRMNDEALQVIIDYGDNPITWGQFIKIWEEKYPNKPYFLKREEICQQDSPKKRKVL